MAIEIKVPPLGESLVDAVVASWHKGEGDSVNRGDVLLELETDKVNLDVTAEEDGVLASIQRGEGETVTVGEVLGTLDAGAVNGQSAAPQAEAAAAAAPAQEAVAVRPEMEKLPAPQPSPQTEESPAEPVAPEQENGVRAAPTIRRIAEEHAIDLANVTGTGPGGRIMRDDLLAYLARQGAAPAVAVPVAPPAPAPPPTLPQGAPAQGAPVAPPPSGREAEEERVRLSRRRQTIAQRLVQAQQTAAMLTTFNEVDMSAVMEVRKRRRETFKERYGVNLGFMSFFTKAVVGALKAFPQVNAELQGNEMVLKRYYDIGIAVGVEDGLVVPVVRNADRLSFAGIEQEIVELATKARENTLSLAELQGGTFTITNGGIFGSLLSTPILNAPQVGILGMHTIQQRPVVRNGEIVIAPMMYLALSYDHRVVDGREAVQFLVRIKELIEDPETLLLEG